MWTQEITEDVARRYSAGESAAHIAREYGITRNAVIGKMYRLNVRGVITRADKRPPVSIPKPRPKPVAPPFKARLINGKPVQLEDLTSTTCRWPIGDPLKRGFHFCGHDVADGKPYCETHSKRAFVKVNSNAEKVHWNLPGMNGVRR